MCVRGVFSSFFLIILLLFGAQSNCFCVWCHFFGIGAIEIHVGIFEGHVSFSLSLSIYLSIYLSILISLSVSSHTLANNLKYAVHKQWLNQSVRSRSDKLNSIRRLISIYSLSNFNWIKRMVDLFIYIQRRRIWCTLLLLLLLLFFIYELNSYF